MTKGESTSQAHYEWVDLAPTVSKRAGARRILRAVASRLASLTGDCGYDTIAPIREKHLALAKGTRADIAPAVSFCVNVFCDLRTQGWRFKTTRKSIRAQAPPPAGDDVIEEKARVRRAHLIERDAQLAQPSVRAFVTEMERRRRWRNDWHSVFSLMRDGQQLAAALRLTAALPEGSEQATALRTTIDPYVQAAVSGTKCKFTGLDLLDIWRYFRHTWITTYQSTPGRKLFFLIRDRAAANHPVIGIGALGSPIMQLSVRDSWIGWTGEQVMATIAGDPTKARAQWVGDSIERLLAGIHVADFIKQRHVTAKEIARPSADTVARLRALAAVERKLHRLYPAAHQHKAVTRPTGKAVDWLRQTHTHLFRSKRAAALADLLDARRILKLSGFNRRTVNDLREALRAPAMARVVSTIVRYTKAAHAGIDMMDVTVCGAIAPYNRLLGGKLVSLLMASPDVAREYAARYKTTPSLIASSMAGRRVCRHPRLVLLGTTSLYGVGASQYHRLRLRVDGRNPNRSGVLLFERLGHTAGYGSYHFSQATMLSLETVLSRQQQGRQVNSIFGEGVNPKLRKVRGALDVVGLPSDLLLQHGSPRIVYGIPLAENFREILLGLAERPTYILPQTRTGLQLIAEHWRQRWLAGRIQNGEVLQDVEQHSTTYPIVHGARVPLPPTVGTATHTHQTSIVQTAITDRSSDAIVSIRRLHSVDHVHTRRPMIAQGRRAGSPESAR